MKIDANSWHVKIYKWWYGHKYGICVKRNSNLCPYMRAVMFWAPLRAIFWDWIKIGPVPLNAITLPAFFVGLPFVLGYVSYPAKAIVFAVYIVAAGVVTALAAIFGLAYLFHSEGLDITRPIKNKIRKSSFLDLIHEYLRSAHDRICPEVSWK